MISKPHVDWFAISPELVATVTPMPRLRSVLEALEATAA